MDEQYDFIKHIVSLFVWVSFDTDLEFLNSLFLPL